MTTHTEGLKPCPMRQAFEEWFVEWSMDDKPEWPPERNCYKDFATHCAWKSWQAAWNARPAQASEAAILKHAIETLERAGAVHHGMGTTHDHCFGLEMIGIANNLRALSTTPAEPVATVYDARHGLLIAKPMDGKAVPIGTVLLAASTIQPKE